LTFPFLDFLYLFNVVLICSMTGTIFFDDKGEKLSLLQYEQPLIDILPSLVGHVNPQSSGIL